MNVKHFNSYFKKLYESVQAPLTEDISTIDELHGQLSKASSDLRQAGNYNIKAYEIAFQDVIERLFPDKSWWEVVNLDIFSDLFANRDPYGTIERICSSVKPEFVEAEPTADEDELVVEEDIDVSKLEEVLSRMNEAEMSDEDKHDSELIRSMIAKMQQRSNAAFTPEEKAVMAKYGITRDNYNKQLTVADRTLNPDLDNDRREYSWSSHRYSNGTPSKINYADRARKLPVRKGNQIAGDGSRVFYQNAHYNAHGHGRSQQDVERAIQADRMSEPMRDMSRALTQRRSAQRSIDNADAERARRMAAAQAAYDKAKKDADWHYDYDTVTSKKYRDGAQAEIDKLLKKPASEALTEDFLSLQKDIARALKANGLMLDPEFGSIEDVADYITASQGAMTVEEWIKETLANYPEYFIESLTEDVEKTFQIDYDSNGRNSAVMVKGKNEEEAKQNYTKLKGDKYPTINGVKELSDADAATNTKKGMSTL